MNYDRYFILTCWMGDELYKERPSARKTRRKSDSTEEQFNLLSQKPLDKYIRSGMPWLRLWQGQQ